MPSFLIDTNTDEVSQTGILETLYLGPVLLYLGPVGPPFQANRPRDIRQNSAKYRPTVLPRASRLQLPGELHQKDLRINLVFMHILGLRMRHVPEGGHVLGLKSNRRVLAVPTLINPPTC